LFIPGYAGCSAYPINSSVINLLIYCIFSTVLILASQVFFKGQMEYARLIKISTSVGDLIQSWLFRGMFFDLKD